MTFIFWRVFFSQNFLCKTVSEQTQVITLYLTSLSLVAVLVGFYLSIEQSRLQRLAQELETFLALHTHAQSTLDGLEADFWKLINKGQERVYDANLSSNLVQLKGKNTSRLVFHKIDQYIETFEWLTSQIPAKKKDSIKLKIFSEGTHQERVYRFFKSI